MTNTRLVNIGQLYGITTSNTCKLGKDLAEVNSLSNSYVEFENGKIKAFGRMDDVDQNYTGHQVDVNGGIVIPSFVDCHTHTVFAKNREDEFVDRIKGLSYQEIADNGGGILNSAKKLGAMSEDELFEESLNRVNHLIRLGTGALEIKSGYGLSVEAELKMLRVIKRLQQACPIPIKATFLGAHAFPADYKDRKEEYIDLIINEMLPVIAAEGLAEYIDAFCEDGYFTVEQTENIVKAGNALGLKARLHVNQFKSFGAIEMAQNNGAISVEHLEVLSDADFEVLKSGKMMAVALPACSFFLKIPYTPARKLIDANVPFVLASDFNPGSSPTGNMSFVMSLASIYMQMLPEEALNAITINAANALELEEEVGSIAIGKRANVLVLKNTKSINSIPYQFGDQLITDVFVNGELF